MHSPTPRLAIIVLVVLAAIVSGCRDGRDAAKREQAAETAATAEAEQIARETTITSATFDIGEAGTSAASSESRQESEAVNNEMVAAFRLEQADARRQLRRALDSLDGEILRAHRTARPGDGRAAQLRARRDLLKDDLAAVERSTEPDWATLRGKVERDLTPQGRARLR